MPPYDSWLQEKSHCCHALWGIASNTGWFAESASPNALLKQIGSVISLTHVSCVSLCYYGLMSIVTQ